MHDEAFVKSARVIMAPVARHKYSNRDSNPTDSRPEDADYIRPRAE